MKVILTLLTILCSSVVFSADRYWISGAGSNWNNTANWSTTSGGAGGASVPGVSDVAIFDANGTGNCTVDMAVSLGGITLSGFTGTIDINGNTFSITSGDCTLNSGTINDTPGTSSFNVSSTGNADFQGTTFGAIVDCSSDRIFLDGSVFNASASFVKTGANNDNSSGGNTFNADVNITNSGTGYFLTANSSPDTYASNVTLVNTGSERIYFADNSAGNTIAGNLTMTNALAGFGIRVARQAGSDLNVSGNVSLSTTGSANHDNYLAINGTIQIGGTFDYTNTCTADACDLFVANNVGSFVQIDGASTITNSGTGANTQRCFLGNNGSMTFNGTLDLINTSIATNSQIYLNQDVTSTNFYNENITVQVTTVGSDGIRFGDNGGFGTLAATKTITVGVGGFVDGFLYFRNFTQTGATAQNITTTGVSEILLYDSNWGGNVSFTTPEITSRGTTYSGTAYLEKTGATNDYSVGGNNFIGDVTFVNSGDGEFAMGNGTADTFGANVDITNSGTSNFRLAHDSPGNAVAGNITAVNTGNANAIILSSSSASSLTVNGNLSFTDSSSDPDHNDYIGNNGDVTISGNLNVTNNSPGDRSDIFVATGTDSQVSVAGATTVLNAGTSAITSRVFLGNDGDCSLNSLSITNSSAAPNSSVFLNNNANSSNTYNGNIVLVVDDANNDGIEFGNGGGSGILSAGLTVTIGGGGFIAGDLLFRNFTQLGSTAQSLSCSGTARIYNYDSNWGGDIDFDAPRMMTRGTIYNGIGDLEKTGGVADDGSVGGNTFVGNAFIRNSGSNYFLMGNTSPDIFQADLDVICDGTDNVYIAYNSTGNTIAGNLSVDMSVSGQRVEFCNGNGSTLTVSGNTTISNSSNAATSTLVFGNSGSIDFDGSVNVTTTSSGTNSFVYFANGASSVVTVDGTFDFNQSTTATGNTESYLGNSGSMTFNDVLTIINASAAANSDIFCNHNTGSANSYNHNIVLSETIATGDGIRFGQGGGSGTLAATRTVTIGVGGFITGDLRFQNFTQLGPTPQTLLTTGDSRIYNYDSNWGGDIDFTAPRMLTRGTTYNGTASLEKSGGIADDNSVGGNTFVGNAVLINTGDNNFTMGDGSPDDFQADLDIINSGTDDIILANNSAGNTIGGNFTIAMSNMAGRVEICNNAASTLTVTGPTVITNNSAQTTNTLLLGDNGSIDFDNNVSITNNGSGTTSRVIIANASTSLVTIDGTFNFAQNSSASNDAQAYLGNNGDITFNGVTTIINACGSNLSDIFCNDNPNSSNTYNENLVLSCTDPSSDGIRFGQSGGNGTLAATKTVSLGVGGFISGDLRFRNFTQIGPTAQSLNCTGTARIYNYDSNWGGDVIFIAPQMLTRGTTYNGTSYLEKTSIGNDQSIGGNLFVGNSELRHTGADQFLMGNGTADVWQSDLIVVNSGAGNMYIAYDGIGHSIAGTLDWTHSGSANDDYLATQTSSDLSVTGNATFINTSDSNGEIYVGYNGDITFDGTITGTNAPIGGANGQLRFANGSNSFVLINDNVLLTNNGAGNTHYIYFANDGSIELNGNLTGSNLGLGTDSYFYMANGTNSSVTINGNTSYLQANNITNTRAYLGNQGDITFNGTLDISNNAQSNNSHVYLNYSGNSLNTYNGNITVTSENAACDGVRFGENSGAGTLTAGNTVSVGGGGFVAGDLYFRNFTQLGGTAQNIVCTGTALISHRSSSWSGDITCTSPQFLTRETLYDGMATLTKNGSGNDDSVGGNTFNGTTIITNSGTGRMRFSGSNGFPDDFNTDATFVKSGSGILQPSYNNTDTYAGDINIDANASLYFGQGGNGRVLFDGAIADQEINDLGTSPDPQFRDFQVNKAAGEVNCNMPVIITVELDLDNGVVNTSATNLMYMNDNTVVSSVSNASHIDGPIEKIGNDAFVFPTGDSAVYRPISISAPTSGSARFRAEYFKVDPHPTYNHLSLDLTLDHISSCEYWILDRISSTNNVFVTLSWDFPTSCEITDLPELAVARWDGAVWRDEGNGGTTGNVLSGTIVSAAAVTNFSPFTLASYTNNNPLPIELLSFEAKLNNEQVDLFWTTVSESNNDYFEIERSFDGQQWEYLETVDGAGTSSITLNYKVIDSKPHAGVNYYRLKQVDFDGNYEFSSVAKVDVPFNNLGNLVIYPNPTNDFIYIEGDEKELGQVVITNVAGQIIEVDIVLSNGVATIDLNNYADGIYFVRTPYCLQKIVKN
ncbi:MAG: T9SS type A sorting domain-containing protein [Crocinitomicaceae bacterium]